MAQGPPSKPNVIVCLLDQLRAFEVGAYGNSAIHTPNMDRLAAGGVRFEIACSNNPVCTPGRSILLSGQYGRTCTGVLGNADEPVPTREKFPNRTIAEAFRSAGYATGLIGKWHVHVDPALLGFDTAFYPLVPHRYTGQTFIDSRDEGFTTDRFCPEVEQEELDRWLSERKETPFFLYYNISQPHMPLADVPERYKTMYSRDTVPLRENVWTDGKPAYNENWFRIYLWDFLFYREHLPYTESLPDGFDLRDLTALYYGATTWADDQVGNLLRMLEENSLLENTILLFTSDHGDNLGSHGLFNKDVLYEESIRVPMIYHWPAGLAPRAIDTQVASLVDVMPTLLSLSGQSIPEGIQGTDLSDVARGEASEIGPNAAFIETTSMTSGVRTLSHLYGLKMDKGPDGKPHGTPDPALFFDLDRDPLQQRNLAGTSEQRDLAGELRERVMEWDAATPWLPSVDC
ncbi:MAG: sulfatase-like hydrolase/transferase [Armatimonadota bacterium]|nr:sulfatase-like hydrolase/transferase [Armatimonadota bacterium]